MKHMDELEYGNRVVTEQEGQLFDEYWFAVLRAFHSQNYGLVLLLLNDGPDESMNYQAIKENHVKR
jgi:hypothetical protein